MDAPRPPLRTARPSRRGAVPPVLGHGDTERHVLPKVIEALHVRAVHIACGWDHSMAVSSDGELFTWGSGSNGKLGHGDDEKNGSDGRRRGAVRWHHSSWDHVLSAAAATRAMMPSVPTVIVFAIFAEI